MRDIFISHPYKTLSKFSVPKCICRVLSNNYSNNWLLDQITLQSVLISIPPVTDLFIVSSVDYHKNFLISLSSLLQFILCHHQKGLKKKIQAHQFSTQYPSLDLNHFQNRVVCSSLSVLRLLFSTMSPHHHSMRTLTLGQLNYTCSPYSCFHVCTKPPGMFNHPCPLGKLLYSL